MEPLTIGMFLAGGVLLIVGANLLVDGASGLAARMGVPPLIVGLTIVAMGTSAPEVAVGVQAALDGKGDIAVGNVVGSNTANLLLILGLTSVVLPCVVARQVLRFDMPMMIATAILMAAMAQDGVFSRWEGVTLCVGMAAYLVYTVRMGLVGGPGQDDAFLPGDADVAKETPSDDAGAAGKTASDAKPTTGRPVWMLIGMLPVGLGLLVLGSDWLVAAASKTAAALGVSELLIGLTVVAVGTSLPELATSIVAALRGERDIAVGNVVGSNIANVLLVMGVTATVAPSPVPVADQALRLDIPVMLVASLAAMPIMYAGGRINRWEGAMMLAGYVGYTVYLCLEATGSAAVVPVRDALVAWVLPVAGLVLVGSTMLDMGATLRRKA